MGVQKSINRFLGTIAGAAYVAARLSTEKYEKGTSASKKKYTEKVNTTKENKNIKKNISERISSETKEEVPTTKVATMADWFPEAAEEKVSATAEEKPAEVKEKVSAAVEEQPAEVKEKVSAFSDFLGVGAEQPAEVKEKISAFNDYLGVGAEQPISPENSQTNIKVDDEVEKLIEVKQKSAARSMGAQKAADKEQELLKYYRQNVAKNPDASRTDMRKYLEQFGYSKPSSYYKSVGLDKSNLQRWQLESEGGWSEHVADKFEANIEKPLRERFNGNEAANDYLDIKLQGLKSRIGADNDEEYGTDENFVGLVDEMVEDLKSGNYKEFAKQSTGKDYDAKKPEMLGSEYWSDLINQATAKETEENYAVWNDESAKDKNPEDFIF